MNDKMQYDFSDLTGKNTSYNGDYLTGRNQELRTQQNVDTIERLFDEWDESDKSSSDDFSLDNNTSTLYQGDSVFHEPSNDILKSEFSLGDSNQTAYDRTSKDVKEADDPLEKTREISSVSLDDMKALQEQLHKLYDEQNEDLNDSPKVTQDGASQEQTKGKALVKATKQGIAFSNGSLTKTFLDCAILCFVTASFGCGMLMYIINHI